MALSIELSRAPVTLSDLEYILIYGAPWESPGRAPSAARSWRLLMIHPGDDSSNPIDVTATYVLTFGSPPVGSQVPIKAMTLLYDPPNQGGFVSLPLYASAIVST